MYDSRSNNDLKMKRLRIMNEKIQRVILIQKSMNSL